MLTGPLARPRGRHARPSRVAERAGQPLLAGVLATAVGGGTAALATAPAAADPAARPAPAVLAFAAEPLPDVAALPDAAEDAALVLAEREAVRASRQRPLPPPPAPPPPPPPPPDVLPGCDAPVADGYANGRIPTSALCEIPGHDGHLLRADAARAFVRLAQAYEAARGEELCVTDTYRSYSAQVALRRQKGRLAAAPGHSNHGTGIAIDLCGGIESFGTSAHRWMRAHAGEHGWVLPTWAREGGRKPEPWHWEFRG